MDEPNGAQALVPMTLDAIEAPPGAVRDPWTHTYTGASLLKIEKSEAEILAAPISDDDLDIKPTGEVYASQRVYRKLLNHAFGHGQWALIPRGPFRVENNYVIREYALYVRGSFVSEAIGGQEYHADNDRMSWDDACEGAKSNALTRCGKDLGIASECWDRRATEAFKDRLCVRVFRQGGKKPEWRRLDAKPFWNETGPTPDSPNRDKYVGPQQQQQKPAQQQTQQPPPSQSQAEPPKEAKKGAILVNAGTLRAALGATPTDATAANAKGHVLTLIAAWMEKDRDAVIRGASPKTQDGTAKLVNTLADLLAPSTTDETALAIYAKLRQAAQAYLEQIEKKK